MPSVKSSSVDIVWLSSTVITPSLPTFVNASAMSVPIVESCAEIVATCAIDFSPSTAVAALSSAVHTASTAASMPRLSAAGLAPAATFLRPAFTIACASTVAVVVPSPATSLVLVATDLASCAPRFSYGSSSSISRAMVTPSLVTVGPPNFLSSTTCRPRGPRVTLTASASWFTPRSSARRAFSSKLICFGIACPSSVHDREDVAGGQDQVLLAVVLDLGAAVLRVDDDVADGNVERDALAVVVDAAGTHGED